jgi:hypothetical protein
MAPGRYGRSPIFGLGGFFNTLLGMWPEIDNEVYWKTTATVGVLAIAFAHAFLLNLPDLDENTKVIQPISSVSIGILVVQMVIAVWSEIHQDGYYRILAVVAIVVGLETLAIPILMKLRTGNREKVERVVLERVRGDIYKDSTGRKFQLLEIKTEHNAVQVKESTITPPPPTG